MTVKDIVEKFGLKVYSGASGLGREVKGGYCSDLLSDVMGFAHEGSVLVTLQAHKNVMAIASLKDLAAIVLVKGIKPEEETADASEAEGIPVLGTSEQCFEFSGKLYDYIEGK
ncbi:MAG: DRTGG domain-containing protein [Bacteroidales bacterium]|jgi:serine kinase of HPr protein (carbohydrate metabolism regulator)|nr:DRTGG domain-containing protein [Bacteroidales bacterium]MCI2121396.1 DRTGG domain-containing protein [Bacteroidales bacterium]MCI2145485.1 DRTGG domain-containing protein [Bacteroidales bacterium]